MMWRIVIIIHKTLRYMKLITALIFTLALIACAHSEVCKNTPIPHDNPNTQLTRFAFGACWKPNRSQGHWEQILKNQPQFWLWLGDNVYANTSNEIQMKKKYRELATEPGYVILTNNTPVIATWDDHDFGGNDIGRDYPMREASEQIFLNFFNEPTNSPRRNRPGIYTSYYFGKWFAIACNSSYSTLGILGHHSKKAEKKPPYRRMGQLDDLIHHLNKTMLGNAQWKWLEQELEKPATFRIIASSIQFSAPFNGYESWSNFPLERLNG